MSLEATIWKSLAGLGLFMLAMAQLEQAFKDLAGSTFKRLLQKYTHNAFLGMLIGVISTAILQSSSVVMLLVLAFVGAGILQLRHALGIVLGTNLGTTLKGWVIASFGFEVVMGDWCFPLIAVGALVSILGANWPKVAHTGRAIFALGLMFLALIYMQSGSSYAAAHLDTSALVGQPLWLFLLAGFLITAVIQSSSTTTVLVMGGLHAQLFDLSQAAALVIGADLGTTITAVLGGASGRAVKRQVAMAHVLFNIATATLAFLLIKPLLFFVTSVLDLQDPLLALVGFHSSMNVIGIALFLPIVGPFAKLLERLFSADQSVLAQHIVRVHPSVPEAGVAALRQETFHLLTGTIVLLQRILRLDADSLARHWPGAGIESWLRQSEVNTLYEALKRLGSEIIAYGLSLTTSPMEKSLSTSLHQNLGATRSLIHAAKSMKDVEHNLLELRNSASEPLAEQYQFMRTTARDFFRSYLDVYTTDSKDIRFSSLASLAASLQANYETITHHIYDYIKQGSGDLGEASMLLNVSREIYASQRALLVAGRDLLLEPTQAADFDGLPALLRL